MEVIISSIISLFNNPILFPIFGGTIIAGILYICRDLPRNIFWFLVDSFTTQLSIYSGENYEAFRCIEDSIKNDKLFYITNRFQLLYKWNAKKIGVGIGEGSLFLTKVNGCWALITKHTDNQYSMWREFYYDIRFFTRNITKIEKFYENEYKNQYSLSEGEEIRIYQWLQDKWDCISKKKIDTDICLNNSKAEVFEKVAFFLSNENFYRDRYLPYREGFIFHGYPGCGKSYFIHQLASAFDLNIYYFNFDSFQNDESFIKAIYQMNQPSIMLIEDIDCFEHVHERSKKSKIDTVKESVKNIKKSKSDEKKSGISLATILNTFDGLLAQDGQIIIATTNHINELDSALIRSGRFNTNLEFRKLKNDEIIIYLKKFYKKEISDMQFESELSIAQLTSICIKNKDINGAIKEIEACHI